MDPEEVFGELPFVQHLGIEIETVDDGDAVGRLPLREEHASNPASMVAHGGVTYSLADTVGGAAVVSVTGQPAPTVDMRIDYLAPATADLRAEAEVLRVGGSVATAEVAVHDADGHHVATATGVYKTSGSDGDSPWEA